MSKFKKVESWKEFYTNFNQYISTLSESRDCGEACGDRDEVYDMLIKDWAEYCAVNKSYIHSGSRELRDKINKQMLYLLQQDHEILTYYLDLFSIDNKDKVQYFSAIKTWINNEFASESTEAVPDVFTTDVKTSVEKKDYNDSCIGDDTSSLTDFLGNDLPKKPTREEMVEDEEKEDSKKEEMDSTPHFEKIVTDTLVGGAKIVGKIVGLVDEEINSVAEEISSACNPRTVKVKVEGPRRLDFLCSIVDFFPPESSHVTETKENDYDIGIYAFNHDNWGDLDTVKEKLPRENRIACNIGPQGGDIYMEPLFNEVWEFERYNQQDILSKLRSFA